MAKAEDPEEFIPANQIFTFSIQHDSGLIVGTGVLQPLEWPL